ncbi:CHAT domain-containing protein [Actinomadura hibisca]|uniref:CHAT domain-containing protein n=1 Tax=Actinomadura hibisca TaxID=68565 RepID=UPI001FE1A2D9|nr:CHAT domain-containing protein [Actinomadura hibisca]
MNEESVGRDPEAAYAEALKLVRARTSAEEKIAALRVAGVAARELGLLNEALRHLDRALVLAKKHDLSYAVAQVRMNLVGVRTARGDVASALVEAAHAADVLMSRDADALAAEVSCALTRAGRLAEARETAERPLSRLRHARASMPLAKLLTSLGLIQALQGVLGGAEATLTEAMQVSETAGLLHQRAFAESLLALVVSRRGDLPRALQLFASAEPRLTGVRATQCRIEQAETLITAGLPREARQLLTTALADIEEHGYTCDQADALLLLAHAELADGEPERAAASAERARAAFAAQERTGWMLLTEHLLLRTRWAGGDRSAVFLSTATATANRLDRGGWTEAAAEARIMAARIALDLRRPAGHLLAPVSGVRGPAALRAAALHATALECHARHDTTGAVTAAWSGLGAIEEHTEVFGALELRARTAELGGELADLALRLARSARELLTVEERRRTIARRPLAVRPPRCPDRAAAFAELRTLSAQHAEGVARGRADSALAARLTRLEAEIRTQSLRNPAPARQAQRLKIPQLAAALGDRGLLEFVRIGSELYAVTIAADRPRRHCLGSYGDAAQAVVLAHSALRRLAQDEGDGRAQEALSEACGRLERLLLEPLHSVLGERELVVAPTGALHGLPWSVLPSLVGRPLTVVPSATAWLHADSRPVSSVPERTLLVAGPDLTHADCEVRALQLLHAHPRVLLDRWARAETVRDALNDADLAHIVAHGEFRPGNPLFSALRLADGPLVVHELEDLDRAPRLVVLSACDIGRAEPGDAVLGMVGALLALGTATVIASVAPVRDAATPAFMTAFHRALLSGHSPSRALAAVPRTPGVHGFQCFGAG